MNTMKINATKTHHASFEKESLVWKNNFKIPKNNINLETIEPAIIEYCPLLSKSQS